MPYIYKYTDTYDVIRYVGIIRSDSNFPERFNQHKQDSWNTDDRLWKIEFAYYESINDVEYLEAFLINKNLATVFNKQKTDYGLGTFMAYDYEPKWRLYKDFNEYSQRIFCSDELAHAYQELDKYTKELSDIKNEFFKKIRSIEAKIKRATSFVEASNESVSVWIKGCYIRLLREVKRKDAIKLVDLYTEYIVFAQKNNIMPRSIEDFKGILTAYFYIDGDDDCEILKDVIVRKNKGKTAADMIDELF